MSMRSRVLQRTDHVDHEKHVPMADMIRLCALYNPANSAASFAGRVETMEQAEAVFDGHGNVRELMCHVYRFGIAILAKDLVGPDCLHDATLDEIFHGMGVPVSEAHSLITRATRFHGKAKQALDLTREFWDMPWTPIFIQFHKSGRRRKPAASQWSSETRATFRANGGELSELEERLSSERGAAYVPWSDPVSYVNIDVDPELTRPFYLAASRKGLPCLTGRSLSCLKLFMLDAALGLGAPRCCRCACIAYFAPIGSHSAHEILDAAADPASHVYGAGAFSCPYNATREEVSPSVLLAGCAEEVARLDACDARHGRAADFWQLGGGQLAPFLQCAAGEPASAPIRLVDARCLVALADEGALLARRQDIDEAGFISLTDLERMQHLPSSLRVVVVSKPWLQYDHPDPKGTDLRLLARALRVLLSHYGGTFAVMLDFISLLQKGRHGEPRTEAEAAIFKSSLAGLDNFFGHPRVCVFTMTYIPAGYPAGFTFPPGTTPPPASYYDRAWCVTEAVLSSIGKPSALWFDLGALATREEPPPPTDGSPAEGLAELRTLCTVGRVPWLSPAGFEARIRRTGFSQAGAAPYDDMIRLYTRHFREVSASIEELDLNGLQWDDTQLGDFLDTVFIGLMPKVRRVDLSGNRIGDRGMFALETALMAGCLPACTVMSLQGNPGDASAVLRVLAGPREWVLCRQLSSGSVAPQP